MYDFRTASLYATSQKPWGIQFVMECMQYSSNAYMTRVLRSDNITVSKETNNKCSSLPNTSSPWCSCSLYEAPHSKCFRNQHDAFRVLIRIIWWIWHWFQNGHMSQLINAWCGNWTHQTELKGLQFHLYDKCMCVSPNEQCFAIVHGQSL